MMRRRFEYWTVQCYHAKSLNDTEGHDQISQPEYYPEMGWLGFYPPMENVFSSSMKENWGDPEVELIGKG